MLNSAVSVVPGTQKPKKKKNMKKSTMHKMSALFLPPSQQHSFPSVLRFTIRWAAVLFIVNIWNLTAFFLYCAFLEPPTGMWLAVQLGIEFIFFIDMALRISQKDLLLPREEEFEMEKLKDFDSVIGFASANAIRIDLVASIPYASVAALFTHAAPPPHPLLVLLHVPRLLRVHDIWDGFKKFESVKKNLLVYFQLLKALLICFFLVHCSACLWLFLAHVEHLDPDVKTWMRSDSLEDASPKVLYLDAVFWAVCTMTSIGYGDILPHTNAEKLVAIYIMIQGATIFASLFGTGALLIDRFYGVDFRFSLKMDGVKEFMQSLELNQEMRNRIHNYYDSMWQRSRGINERTILDHVPISLRVDVLLDRYKDMISRVSVFQITDQAFVNSTVRALRPQICLPNDYVMHIGEIGSELYFIQTGKVQVISGTGETICTLGEGGYFGEIALLEQKKRSASIRAVTICDLAVLGHDDFQVILKQYPEHATTIRGIATARSEQATFHVDSSLAKHVMKSVGVNIAGQDCTLVQETQIRFSVNKSGWFRTLYFHPTSPILRVWQALSTTAVLYYWLTIPYTIAFDVNIVSEFWVLEIFMYLVYVLDMFVSSRSAYMHEGALITDKDSTTAYYLNSLFVFELISIVPLDVLALVAGFSDNHEIMGLLRLPRLLRSNRFFNLLADLAQWTKLQRSLIRIIGQFVLFLVTVHWQGCIFYFISRMSNEEDSWVHEFGSQKWIDANSLDKDGLYSVYVNSIYWAFLTVGTVAYGDIIPASFNEKMFGVFAMLLAKLLLAFIYADAALLIGSLNGPDVRFRKKMRLVKDYMQYHHLPLTLRSRIVNFHECLWAHTKGIEEKEILNDMPNALRSKVLLQRYHSMIEKVFVLAGDQPLVNSVVRMLKSVIVSADEYIVRAGEIGSCMYIVVEGEAEVFSIAGLHVAYLSAGNHFGEMSLLAAGIRKASVKSITACNLVSLSSADFHVVLQSYPHFKDLIFDMARTRQANLAKSSAESARIQPLGGQRRATDFSSRHRSIASLSELLNVQVVSRGILQPGTYFLRTWDIVETLLVLYHLAYIPIEIAFKLPLRDGFLFMDIFSDVLFSTRIFLFFRTAYYCEGTIVQDAKRIRQRYLKGDFAFDVLSALPFGVILTAVGWDSTVPHGAIAAFRCLRFLHLTVVLRVFALLKSSRRLSNGLVRIFEVIFFYSLVVHALACGWLLLGLSGPAHTTWFARCPSPLPELVRTPDMPPLTPSDIYLHAIYWALITVSHIGTGDITPVNTAEKLYVSATILIGTFAYAFFFGNIASYVAAIGFHNTNFQKKLFAIMDYSRLHKIPTHIEDSIKLYFDYYWGRFRGISENPILEELPDALSTDVLMFRYQHMIPKVQLFKVEEIGFIRKCVSLIQSRTYMPGDYVLMKGRIGVELYFVIEGHLQQRAVPGESSAYEIRDGAVIGEEAIFQEQYKIKVSVCSILVSWMGVLSRTDVLDVLEHYPLAKEHFLSCVPTTCDSNADPVVASGVGEDVIVPIPECAAVDTPIIDRDNTGKATKHKTNSVVPLPPPSPAKSVSRQMTWKMGTTSDVGMGRFSFLPNSSLLLYWGVAHLLMVVYSAAVVPFEMAFAADLSTYWLFLDVLRDLVFMVDIAVSFRTAFFDNGRLVNNFSDVSYRYLRHGFVTDLLSALPTGLLFVAAFNGRVSAETTGMLVFILVLRGLKLMRIPRIFSSLNALETDIRVNESFVFAAKAVLYLFLLWHWSACIWYFTASLQAFGVAEEDLGQVRSWVTQFGFSGASVGDIYLNSAYFVMVMVTSVGYGDIVPTTNHERIVAIVIVLVGDAFFAVAFGRVAALVNFQHHWNSVFAEQISHTDEYMRFHGLNNRIRRRVLRYFYYMWSRYKRAGAGFADITNDLPVSLRGTIAQHLNATVIRNAPLFKGWSQDLILSICAVLQPQVYSPDDYIIRRNEVATEMYFITKGRVNVLSVDELKVVVTLTKGDFFGEVALLRDERRLCSVRALLFCEIYSLHKANFERLTKENPDMRKFMDLAAEERSQHLKRVSNEPKEAAAELRQLESRIAATRDVSAERAVKELADNIEHRRSMILHEITEEDEVTPDDTDATNELTNRHHSFAEGPDAPSAHHSFADGSATTTTTTTTNDVAPFQPTYYSSSSSSSTATTSAAAAALPHTSSPSSSAPLADSHTKTSAPCDPSASPADATTPLMPSASDSVEDLS